MTMTLNETDRSIRTFFAEYLNDAKQGKACIGHKEPKWALCGKYDIRLMYRAMCEGTLGRAFRTFAAADPKRAEQTIRFALAMWDISGHNPAVQAKHTATDFSGVMVGMGAFAHSFTEIVAEMAEPYLPMHVNHFGHNAWMLDAWDWFAQNVAK